MDQKYVLFLSEMLQWSLYARISMQKVAGCKFAQIKYWIWEQRYHSRSWRISRSRNFCLNKTIEAGESEAHINFFQHSGKIEKNTVFRIPKKEDRLYVLFVKTVCTHPEPKETKRGRKFDKAIIEVINNRFTISQTKNKNLWVCFSIFLFALHFFICLY